MEFLREFENFADSIDGKIWVRNCKKRIYFKVDKTAAAFLDYDYDDFNPQNPLENASLKVFSDCYAQSRAWNINRAKKLKFEIMKRISNVTGCEICKSWEEVIL